MKKLSLQLFAILLICFVVMVSIQYWHQGSLFKHWLNKDFKENGRMIFNNILRHENNFWIGAHFHPAAGSAGKFSGDRFSAAAAVPLPDRHG
jgi:hypothetical protein